MSTDDEHRYAHEQVTGWKQPRPIGRVVLGRRTPNPHPDPFTDRLYSDLGIARRASERLAEWMLERLAPHAADEVVGQALEHAPMLNHDVTPEAWIRTRVTNMTRPADEQPRTARRTVESPTTYLHHADQSEKARVTRMLTELRAGVGFTTKGG